MLIKFTIWLKRFNDAPNYNRWLAGLHGLLWTRHCGHDWAFAWKIACINWK